MTLQDVVLLIPLVSLACNPFDSFVPQETVVARFAPQPAKGADYLVPDTVRASVPFDVVIVPRLGCGIDAAPAIVQVAGLVADVTARAVIPGHSKGTVFTCEGRVLDKSVGAVTFSKSGTGSVRLHGQTISRRDTTIVVPVVVLDPAH